MSAVLITGMSGAGKSTIAEVLAHRGLISIDADNDPLRARSVDSDGSPSIKWWTRYSPTRWPAPP